MNSDIPILHKRYDYFDDGKITLSRKYEVVITEVIPFSDIDNDILEFWKNEVTECNWLYSNETDYFVKADLKIDETTKEEIIFVRTIHNDWFSLGYWGGRLDIDDELFMKLLRNL